MTGLLSTPEATAECLRCGGAPESAAPASPGWRMQYSCVGEGEDCSLDLKWLLSANGHLLELSLIHI